MISNVSVHQSVGEGQASIYGTNNFRNLFVSLHFLSLAGCHFLVFVCLVSYVVKVEMMRKANSFNYTAHIFEKTLQTSRI